jgi:FSR family fosmidomycin resistance protein-like MFS transporter
MAKKFFFSSFGKSLFVLWLSHIVMDFFTGIWPIYKTVAQIDLAKAGLIAGVSGFLGEILQVGFGYFCDRGHRKLILITGLILSSSIIWITFTESLFTSFWILLLLMIGSGSFHPAGVGYAGSLSKEHKGKTILLFASGGALGLGISQLVFTKVFAIFNGHVLILYAPVVLTILMVMFHKFPEHTKTTNILTYKELVKPFLQSYKPLTFLYFAQITSYSVSLAFLFLLPDLMMTKTSSQWLVMGGAHLCFILGATLALPCAGIFCDKVGQKNVLITAISCSFLLMYLLLHLSNINAYSAAIILMCLGGVLQSINPIIVSWGHKIIPESPSTISALLMGFAWCFTSFGPTCAGFLCKKFQEEAVVQTLSSMGILLLFSLFFIILLPAAESSSQEDELIAEPQIDTKK